MMKKFYFLMLFAFIAMPASIVLGQNIVINGDLELWDDPSNPTSWTKAENISQETSPVHGGTYSAGHTSADGTQDFQQDITGVVAGSNYTISYYYLDNSTTARTRIWSYWLSGSSTLPDNEEELRPGTYSEDNADWQHVTFDLTAPAGADGFRFEVRVYKQDGVSGGMVYYDDFTMTSAGVAPEPTNYPTDFAAAAAGVSINLTWTDATGAQLPSGYLVLGSTEDNITAPVDGTPVADDPNLADGTGALNIGYGAEACMFANLDGNTPYYFKIYPYTNGAADIDYKNDGTAPAATATTPDISIIEAINFEDGWGDWQRISIVGAQEWEIDTEHGVGGSSCAKCSGYAGGANANEDWLISPAMNFDNFTDETLNFYNAVGYDGPPLEAMISNDYDGSDPSSATWTDLAYISSPDFFDWTSSGDIDISSLSGSAVYVAFKYTSTATDAATWEIDNIIITGNEVVGINDIQNIDAEVNIYPNPATDRVFISSDKNAQLSVNIYSLSGQKVMDEINIIGEGTIDLGNINAGIYLMRCTDEAGNAAIKKLIIE
jgi:hypothetical protein